MPQSNSEKFLSDPRTAAQESLNFQGTLYNSFTAHFWSNMCGENNACRFGQYDLAENFVIPRKKS